MLARLGQLSPCQQSRGRGARSGSPAPTAGEGLHQRIVASGNHRPRGAPIVAPMIRSAPPGGRSTPSGTPLRGRSRSGLLRRCSRSGIWKGAAGDGGPARLRFPGIQVAHVVDRLLVPPDRLDKTEGALGPAVAEDDPACPGEGIERLRIVTNTECRSSVELTACPLRRAPSARPSAPDRRCFRAIRRAAAHSRSRSRPAPRNSPAA